MPKQHRQTTPHDWVHSWIPEADIDWEVIKEDITSYLGENATVFRGNYPEDHRPGYIIKSYRGLTVAHIRDLRWDTNTWHDERNRSCNREYSCSETHKRRQELGPTRPLADFHATAAEPPLGTDLTSARAGPHKQSGESRVFPPNISANYGYSCASEDLRLRQETQGTASNGQRKDWSGYTRADVELSIARSLKNAGHTQITRSQLDQAVDKAMQVVQQQQASMQPSCEISTVRRQMLTGEIEAQAPRCGDSLGLSQPETWPSTSGTLPSQATLGDYSFKKSKSGSSTNLCVEVTSQSGATLSSAGFRSNSKSMNRPISGENGWHLGVVQNYEDSILAGSHAPAPSQPKHLLPDDVTTLFAELGDLILGLWDLARLPDTKRIRLISERLQRRIAIFEELQGEIHKLEDRNRSEVSIREEMQRRIYWLEDPGLQVLNQKAPPVSTASTGQDENAIDGLKTRHWEMDLSRLLAKVDWELMSANIATPIIAFCYSSLLSCCWSVSGVKLDGVASGTAVIGDESSSGTKQDVKYLCPFCTDQKHPFPEPDCLLRHLRVAHTNNIMTDPQLRPVFERLSSFSNDGSQAMSNEKRRADADSGYASSIAPSKISESSHSTDSGFGSSENLIGTASQNPAYESARPVNEAQTMGDASSSSDEAQKYHISHVKPGTSAAAAAPDAAIARESSRSTSPGPVQSPAHSLYSSVGSEGEMSFAYSSDSDSALEKWEADLDPELIRIRSHLVQRLVESYTRATSEVCDAMPHNVPSDPATSSRGSSNNSSSSLSRTTHTTQSSIAKHKLCQDDEEGDLQDRDGPPRRKRTRVTTESISLDGRLFACPYSKHDPIRFSERNIDEKHYRGCSSSYLSDISRLKQHLYRIHRKPEFYCRRCFEIFKSEAELDSHARNRPSCEPCVPQFAEKMSVEQMANVKRRKPGKTPADTWFAIFRILFPEAALPQSPYADSVSSDAVRSFMDLFQRQAQANLSELIREQLGSTLVLHRDQQRILDSALEISIAQLVMQIGPSDREAEPQQVALELSEVGLQTALDRDMDATFANDVAREPQVPQASDFAAANTEDDDTYRPLTWTSLWPFEGEEEIESIFR